MGNRYAGKPLKGTFKSLKGFLPLLIVLAYVCAWLLFTLPLSVWLTMLTQPKTPIDWSSAHWGFFIVFMISPLVVSFSLLISPKIWSKSEDLQGRGLQILFLFILALSLYIIVSITMLVSNLQGEPVWGLMAIILTLTVVFILPWLLPAALSRIERLWWRFSMGESAISYTLRDRALKEFQLTNKQYQADEGLQPPVAAIFAANTRLIEFPGRHRILKRRKRDMEQKMFEDTIKDLNGGWRVGLPSEILNRYMKFIENTSEDVKDEDERLQGLCAVANVKFFLGESRQASALARKIEKDAENNLDPILRWIVLYTSHSMEALYEGKFDEMVTFWAAHWRDHINQKPEQRKDIETKIHKRSNNDLLTINPVLALPRQLILFSAFNGGPWYDKNGEIPKELWPTADPPAERKDELKWVNCWYMEGERAAEHTEPKVASTDVGDDVSISRQLDNAVMGLYLTLLYPTRPTNEVGKQAQNMFESFEGNTTVTRYARAGYYGIYKLVAEDDPETALQLLQEAAVYSQISGHRFAIVDLLFSCCQAVAAERIAAKEPRRRYLREDADLYLKKAEEFADNIRRPFYSGIYEGACAAVYHLREKDAQAKKHEHYSESLIDENQRRILQIFEPVKSLTV